MTVIDRADRDIAEGNHWLARQRLESRLLSAGYDPELLIKLGDISAAMHDAFNAGRFWMTSTAEGAHIEEAIAVFTGHLRHNATQIASELPRACRLPVLSAYPPVVQERLQRLKLDAAVIAASPSTPPSKERMPWGVRIVVMVVIILTCISCVVGVWQIAEWLIG